MNPAAPANTTRICFLPSHGYVAKTGPLERGALQRVSAVQHDGRTHGSRELGPRQRLVLGPFGRQHERVRALGNRRQRFAVVEPGSSVELGTAECDGVVHAHLRAALEKAMSD